MSLPDNFKDLFLASNSWAVDEAKKILERIEGKTPKKGYVLFETGYGPSGLPHIGTFGEVARTTVVREAFQRISDIPTRLFAFSDDMDGLRKIPDNVPNKDIIIPHLAKSLTSIPDPFGKYESFAHHNNAKLREFLDHYGFEYEFISSTTCYKSGQFNKALLRVLECYEDIRNIILPTLGEERRQTYSPFLPVSPKTGRVLQVAINKIDIQKGTITFQDEDGTVTELPVTDGHCKLQWKVDWAMRWYSLDVDYEMCGADLIDSYRLSSEICKVLGMEPPLNLTYSLFIDEEGHKISKSKGNGISIDEWLEYAPQETLSLFMYKEPTKIRKLHFGILPALIEEYIGLVDDFHKAEKWEEKVNNPVWFIHNGNVPKNTSPISFNTLLNVVSTCTNEPNAEIIWGFVQRYRSDLTPESYPFLDKLIGYALAYYRDFVEPLKNYRLPTDQEKEAFRDVIEAIRSLPADADSEAIQFHFYEVGKNKYTKPKLREWFKAVYEVIFGTSDGPRMGAFVLLVGREKAIQLIEDAISGNLVSKNKDRSEHTGTVGKKLGTKFIEDRQKAKGKAY
jgi:lysyl-tRNA synthetase class 1